MAIDDSMATIIRLHGLIVQMYEEELDCISARLDEALDDLDSRDEISARDTLTTVLHTLKSRKRHGGTQAIKTNLVEESHDSQAGK